MGKSPKPGDLLTRRELSELDHPPWFPCLIGTVTKWEQNGLPCAERGGRGRASLYRWRDVVKWLTTRDVSARAGPNLNLAQERARKEKWQAKLTEQTFEERAGNLLRVEDVKRVWDDEVAAVRRRLLAIPDTQADQIHRAGVLDGPAGTEAALSAAIRAVLVELSAGEHHNGNGSRPKPKPERRTPAKKKRAGKKATKKKAAKVPTRKKKRATKRKAAR